MKQSIFRAIALCGLIVLAIAAQPRPAAALDGKTLAEEHCGKCHDMSGKGRIIVGPPLNGVVGRPSAKHETFKYSDALRGANVTWTTDEIKKMIENPKDYLPKSRMKFKGVPDAAERDAIVSWLATFK